MAIELTDDGTLDTVLRCSECSEELRYSQREPSHDDPTVSQDGPGGYWRASDDQKAFATEQGAENALGERLYAEHVASCIEDATADHECSTDDDETETEPTEPTEPTEDDLVTYDHITFWYYGLNRVAFVLREQPDLRFIVDASPRRYVKGQYATVERAIRAFMQAEQYWPNCWFVSDHGNAHLMDLDRA